MKKTILTALLILLLSLAAQAQMSRPDLEEALKYFPDGYCGGIEHTNDAALASSKLFNKYRGAFSENFGSPKLDVLPPALRQGLVSRTISRNSRLKKFSGDNIVTEKVGDGHINRISEKARNATKGEISGEVHTSETVDGITRDIILANVSVTYRVYRFSNIEAALADALKKQQITKAEIQLREQPVYLFNYADYYKRNHEMLAFATPAGELLVAKSLDRIKDMLDAADGSSANIMENPGYRQAILHLSSHMAATWSIWFTYSTTKIMVKQYEESGKDPERLAAMKKSLECGECYQFTSESFDKNYVKYKQFKDCGQPVTKGVAHELQPFEGYDIWPKEVNDFYISAEKFKSHKVDKENNILEIICTYDEEYLAKDVEMTKITRKIRDERRKAREEAKKKAAAQK